MSRISSAQKRKQRSRMSRRRRRFCASCGAVTNLTIDHIIPLAKGGTNTQDNLQMLCKKCNEEKADYNPYNLREAIKKIT